jgi:hypothetical protein
MRRLLSIVFVCLVCASALAASVTTHVNPNGSITFTVLPAAGESIRDFHVWLPPGSATGGQPAAPTTGDGTTVLHHWQQGTQNGPAGGGWSWNNPGMGGNVAPLGPDGGSFTITPNYNASPEDAFAGTWSTTDDGSRGTPPRGGHFGPHTTDHGAITDGGGHIIPLPTKWVRVDFPSHTGDPNDPCSCLVGGSITGRATLEGLDGTESPTLSVYASTGLARAHYEQALPLRGGKRLTIVDDEPYYGLDRYAPVPSSWAVHVNPEHAELAPGLDTWAEFSITVAAQSQGRGHTFYVVIAADFDGDGIPDAWSIPNAIRIE